MRDARCGRFDIAQTCPCDRIARSTRSVQQPAFIAFILFRFLEEMLDSGSDFHLTAQYEKCNLLTLAPPRPANSPKCKKD